MFYGTGKQSRPVDN